MTKAPVLPPTGEPGDLLLLALAAAEEGERLEGLDFIKAGHHGSSSSTGKALAEMCRPQAFFVSAGADNPYAHPSMASAERILAASPGAQIWRTDEVGSILLTIRADGTWSAAAVRDLA